MMPKGTLNGVGSQERGFDLSGYVDVHLYIGTKKIKAGAVIAALVILAVIAALAVLVFIPPKGIYTLNGCRQMLRSDRYIIHAGGFVEDETGEMLSYTNSREALENCYENGNRICELDFMMTSDGKVVCAHNEDEEDTWAHGIVAQGKTNEQLNFYEFMGAKFNGMLTTMSLENLTEFMREHTDFYIVTDVKDDNIGVCGIISEDYPDLRNRFIVQIYHPDEYERIRELGFCYVIYTLYMATPDELTADATREFINDADLVGVTFWMDYPESFTESFEVLRQSGLPLFVHTVNDKEQMESYIDMGIDGIYTDVVNKEDQFF